MKTMGGGMGAEKEFFLRSGEVKAAGAALCYVIAGFYCVRWNGSNGNAGGEFGFSA